MLIFNPLFKMMGQLDTDVMVICVLSHFHTVVKNVFQVKQCCWIAIRLHICHVRVNCDIGSLGKIETNKFQKVFV